MLIRPVSKFEHREVQVKVFHLFGYTCAFVFGDNGYIAHFNTLENAEAGAKRAIDQLITLKEIKDSSA